MSAERVTYNCCQGWGCHEHCMLETHTVDGKIVRTQKSFLPGKIGVGNQICQKGAMAWKAVYSDKRLLHPLKRVGERGEGKFEQISWDQAFAEITAKINETAEKYGKKSIIVNEFMCGIPGYTSSVNWALSNRFVNTYQATALESSEVDFAIIWSDTPDVGNLIYTGKDLILQATDNVVIWGGNPIGFTRPARTTRLFLDAKERGCKLFHISNLFDNTSAKVDTWVPVKSGTDAALALAMCNVVIGDGNVDEAFLKRVTCAPFLVRDDTNKYLREADVVDGGAQDKFAVFDKKAGKVVFMPRGTEHDYDWGEVEPAIEYETEIAGTTCKTAYNRMVESIAQWTPEEQEKVTGVPAQQCIDLARELAAKPMLMCIGNGLRYSNGMQTARAIKLFCYLTGNYDRPGRSIMASGSQTDDPRCMVDRNHINFEPTHPELFGTQTSLPTVIRSFDDPSAQQYKVWIQCMGNPMLNWPNTDMWQKEIFPHMEMIVTFEIRMTDTCLWSDYVLPEATIFERHEFITDTDNCAILVEPAIEPRGESKTVSDIWRGIAEGVGVGEFFQKTQKEWAQYMIEGGKGMQVPLTAEEDPEHAGELAPLTMERLEKAKALHMDLDDNGFNMYAVTPFFTPTGRLEFYSEYLAETGDQVARFQDTIVLDKELLRDYPLQFFNARHKYFMQGQFTNIPEMDYLASTQFGVAMNPKTAMEKGLRDGDVVEVYNQRGTMRATLQYDESVAPGIAHSWYSFPQAERYPDTDCPQKLATPLGHPSTETPIHVSWGARFYWEIFLKDYPKTIAPIAGESTPEVIWDTLCNVRKAAN